MKTIAWDDYLNPVLVKEVRQYFHNRMLVWLMVLLLAGQLLSLIFIPFLLEGKDSLLTPFGSGYFTLLLTAVGICSFLVCGYGTMQRFCQERSTPELDFSNITTLSPYRIVGGKLAGACVITCYFYALILPFMVIAYFLRGIEMTAMLSAVLLMFPVLMLAAQVGILTGASGKKGIGGLFISFSIFFASSSMGVLGSIFLNPHGSGLIPTGGIFFLVILELFLLGLLFVLSVAAISPSTSNRMFPVRIYLTALIPLIPICGYVTGVGTGFKQMVEIMCISAIPVIVILATLASFERAEPGDRVLRQCPEGVFGRMFYFLFSSGGAGGFLLSWLLLLFVCGCFFPYAAAWSNLEEGFVLLAVVCYFLFYGELSFFLWRKFNRLSNWHWWLIIIGTLGVFPTLLGAMLTGLIGKSSAYMGLITTPFCLIENANRGEVLIAAPVFVLIGLFLNLPWIVKQIRQFRKQPEKVQ